jgi:exonuclease SbcD
MVKVLISADWHIGKRLHQVDLKEDLLLFFDWLIEYIETHQISYLLVSGDIFDHSNPSQEAQEVYYNFLKRIYTTGCKAIITAGNHDSPGFLEVGKSLATLANAHVVGYYPGIDEVENIFFELKDLDGVSHAVVAAIPFIADRFARQVGEGEGAAELAEKLKLGIKKVYEETGNALSKKYPNLIRIGMGHLHAMGSLVNEEEREIMIGGEGGVPVEYLNQFDFLGLGHIHIGNSVTDTIRYASSPISLGFSEENYNHKVIQLDIVDGKYEQSDIPIPKFRILKSLQGNFEQVTSKLMGITENPCALNMLLDLKITEPKLNFEVRTGLQALKEKFLTHPFIEIINIRLIEESENETNRLDATMQTKRVSEMQAIDIFDAVMSDRLDGDEMPQDLRDLFITISTDALQQQ